MGEKLIRTGSVEVEVRGIRPCPNGSRQAVAIVGPCKDGDGRVLSLSIAPGDAHALLHELRGQETTRSQALCLAGRVAEALGGRLVGVHLAARATGLVRSSVVVQTNHGLAEVPIEPGQALAATLRLGLLLTADCDLFTMPDEEPAPMSKHMANFLETVDFSGLGER